jgi:hypothetical protein
MNTEEFSSPAANPAKTLAYQSGSANRVPISGGSGSLFRLERGAPYLRAGRLVFATPQFKTQTLYSLTNKNAQLPSTPTAPGSIIHPVKTK